MASKDLRGSHGLLSSDSIGKQVIGIANGIATFGLVFNNQLSAFASMQKVGKAPPATMVDSINDDKPMFGAKITKARTKSEEELNTSKPAGDDLKLSTLRNLKNIEEVKTKLDL